MALALLLVLTNAGAQSISGPIIIEQNTDAAALAAALTSSGNSGLTIRQSTLQGHSGEGTASSGLYYLGLEGPNNGYGLNQPGIVLSTGNVSDYQSGENFSTSRSTGYNVPATMDQETLLDPITGTVEASFNHFDVTQLDVEFDVTSDKNYISFYVVFGSEEYAEYVNSQFIDGFGIYLNGQNIALASGKPVNINHPEMSAIAGTELDGVLNSQGSVIMQFTALVEPGSVENKLTFIVADTSDDALDTTVYIFSLESSVPPPPLTISNGSVVEGNDGVRNMVFQVELSDVVPDFLQTVEQTVQVSFNTQDLTARAGVDYTATSGLLTFPPGITSRQILVPILGDTVAEGNETFQVRLTNPIGASYSGQPAVGTIIDDDADTEMTVFASVSDVTVTEGNSGTVEAVFTIMLSCPSSQIVQVNYRAANSSATSVADFVAASGMVEFEPGELQKTVTVLVNGDTLNERDEKFLLILSNPVNAIIGDDRGTATILNDDPATTEISIFNTSVQESSSGTAVAVFQVCLSEPSGQVVSVKYTTANGTALAGIDYSLTSGTITIPAGVMVKTISVPVLSDAVTELDENFYVQLSAPKNATIAQGLGVGTILNNAAPAVSIHPVSVTEGNEGTTIALFEVTLAAASEEPVAVTYATQDGTATVADNDYSPTSGVLFFAPGETSKSIEVMVQGDLVNESDETFFVNLGNDTNPYLAGYSQFGQAVLLVGRATGTIINDDPVTTQIFIEGMTVLEPSAGSVKAAFNVMLSEPSGQKVTVRYATADGTALAGSDYAGRTGLITFMPGITSREVVVVVNGDTLPEDDETFTVNLHTPVNAVIGEGQGLATILNATEENTPTTLSIANTSVLEGNTGTTQMVFTVTMPFPSEHVVTVQYVTANSSAKAGLDYISTAGTLTFPPGTTTQTITVQVLGDEVYEPNEALVVNLSNPVNALLLVKKGVGTIVNDEPLPKITILDTSTVEGDNGSRYMEFELMLSGASSKNITVNFATADGSAYAPASYAARNGILVFPSGTTTQCVAVVVYGNVTIESDKTMRMLLTRAVNAAIEDGEGIGTIVNDDGLPGHLDHFTWSTISSPQIVNEPFAVTITARDRFGDVVPDYSGIVNLSAIAVSLDAGGHDLLGSPVHQLQSPGNVTVGYAFTPSEDMVVTHFRHYNGSKVSLWSNSGQLLASRSVVSTPGTWKNTSLGSPVLLKAGTTYRVGVQTTGYYYRFSTSSTFAHGSFGGNFQSPSDNFPTQSLVVRPFVDLVYSVYGGSQAVAVQPQQSGVFVNGVWNGQIVMPATADLVSVQADDGFNHIGTSGSFVVQAGVSPMSLKLDVSAAVPGNLQLQSVGPSVGAGNLVRLFFTPRQPYVIETSQDLNIWTPVFTNTTGSASSFYAQPVNAGQSFYRAVLMPK